jgi:hypothetical protein
MRNALRHEPNRTAGFAEPPQCDDHGREYRVIERR